MPSEIFMKGALESITVDEPFVALVSKLQGALQNGNPFVLFQRPSGAFSVFAVNQISHAMQPDDEAEDEDDDE